MLYAGMNFAFILFKSVKAAGQRHGANGSLNAQARADDTQANACISHPRLSSVPACVCPRTAGPAQAFVR